MKRLLALSLAVMFIVASAGVAFAHGGHWSGFNLTPEQVTKMQQLSAESYAAMNPVMQQIRAKRAELKAQMYSASPDKGKIETLASEIGSLKGKLYIERVNLNAKFDKEGLPQRYGNCRKGGMMGMGRGMR